MKKLTFHTSLLLLFLILAGFSSVKAQRNFIGIHFEMGAPTGEHAQYQHTLMGGLKLNYGHSIAGDSPFYITADASFMNHGTSYYYVIMNGYDYDAVQRSNSMSGHIGLRIEPFKRFPVHPYGEIKAGGKYIYTTLSYEDPYVDPCCDPTVAQYTLNASPAWSYGYGGGIKIRFSEHIDMDMNMTVLKGGYAHYMRADIEQEFQSETDVVSGSIGLNILF